MKCVPTTPLAPLIIGYVVIEWTSWKVLYAKHKNIIPNVLWTFCCTTTTATFKSFPVDNKILIIRRFFVVEGRLQRVQMLEYKVAQMSPKVAQKYT